MSNLFSSSIGRKLVMSISGLFLIAFLFIHLGVNALMLINDGGETYNIGVHFMGHNPIIKFVEPILALGFLFHIIYAGYLTTLNRKARGKDKYASGNNTKDVSWTSKNMWILGLALLAFLVLHIFHFWTKMKLTGSPLLAEVNIDGVMMENGYALVHAQFQHLWVCIVYAIAAVCLAMHISHGFWSAFQTIGASNNIWRKRLSCIGVILAWIFGLGFALIPILQYLFY